MVKKRSCPNCPRNIGKAKKEEKLEKTVRVITSTNKKKKSNIKRLSKRYTNKKYKTSKKYRNDKKHMMVDQNNEEVFRRSKRSRVSHHVYYGVERKSEVSYPVEGDIFVNIMTGEWSIYRHSIWNQIPIPAPRTYFGPSIPPETSIYNPQEGSIYYDMSGRIYMFQNTEWKLLPLNINPLTTKPLNISLDPLNPSLTNHTFMLNLSSSETLITIDIMTSNYYHSLIKPKLCENAIEFEVIPHGKQKITIEHLKKTKLTTTLGNWIQYKDSHQEDWQILLAITYINLYDEH